MRVPGLGRAWPFLTAATFLEWWFSAASARGARPDQTRPNGPSGVTNASLEVRGEGPGQDGSTGPAFGEALGAR